MLAPATDLAFTICSKLYRHPAHSSRCLFRYCIQMETLTTLLERMEGLPAGAFWLLLIAALLEVGGDWIVRQALGRSGSPRIGLFVVGGFVLWFYGVMVNSVKWDFGKLLGVYVVVFFVVAQVVAWRRPAPPILLGGALIIAGGVVMTVWKAN